MLTQMILQYLKLPNFIKLTDPNSKLLPENGLKSMLNENLKLIQILDFIYTNFFNFYSISSRLQYFYHQIDDLINKTVFINIKSLTTISLKTQQVYTQRIYKKYTLMSQGFFIYVRKPLDLFNNTLQLLFKIISEHSEYKYMFLGMNIKMVIGYHRYTFLLCIFVLGMAVAQQLARLELGQQLIVRFNKNEEKTFDINLIAEQNKGSYLYIDSKLSGQQKAQFLQPRITLVSSQSKTILTCNQVSNKFYEMCRIQLSSIKQTNKIKVKIKSLAEGNISIQVYTGNKYKINIGQQVFLQADQQLDDKMQTQLLVMQVPEDMQKFQTIQLCLTQLSLSPYGVSRREGQFGMSLEMKSQWNQTFRPLSVSGVSRSLVGNKVLVYTITSKQIKRGDYILVNVTFNDQFSRLRFQTLITIKDQLIKSDVNVLEVNSYYSLQLQANGIATARYDTVFNTIKKDQEIQLIVYCFSGRIQSIQMFLNLSQKEESRIKLYPSKQHLKVKSGLRQSFYRFSIKPQQLLRQLHGSNKQIQPSKSSFPLYILLKSTQPTQFQLSLRINKIDRVIQQQWPQIAYYYNNQYNNEMKNTTDQQGKGNLPINGVNYLFQDCIEVNNKTQSRSNGKKSYIIQINDEMNYFIKNKEWKEVKLVINRCQSIQSDKDGTLSCFDQTTNHLTTLNQTNNEAYITLKTQHPLQRKYIQLVNFEYDLAQCPIFTYAGNYSIHKCYFNLFFFVLTNGTNQQQLQSNRLQPFSFTLHKKQTLLPLTIPQSLEQLSLMIKTNPRYYLSANRQAFYLLSIVPPKVAGIQLKAVYRTTVHLTTYHGDCIIFGSRYDKYPQFHLIQDSNYDIGSEGFIQIKSITQNQGQFNYFISVYCYQQAGYNLNVITKYLQTQRIFSNDLQLEQDYPQQMTLRGQDKVRFKIDNRFKMDNKDSNLSSTKNLILQIDQIKGMVKYQVYSVENDDQQSKKVMQCPLEVRHQKRCILNIPLDSTVYVEVSPFYLYESGQKQDRISRFIIFTRPSATTCITYPSNYPQFISLTNKQKHCTLFIISKYEDLQLTLSTNLLQLLLSPVQVYVTFNDRPNKVRVDDMKRLFSGKQLREHCQYEGSEMQQYMHNSVAQCEMKVSLQSEGGSSYGLTLQQVIQYSNQQTVLLNGLQRLSSINSLSRHHSKRYFYYLENYDSMNQDVKVSIRSQNRKRLILVTKVQNAYNFQTKLTDYYPGFPAVQDKRQFVIKLTNRQTSGSFYVPQDKTDCRQFSELSQKRTKQCVLLVSVFSDQEDISGDEEFIYSIEVNQGFTQLSLGENVQQVVTKGKSQKFQVMSLNNINTTVQIFSSSNCYQAHFYSLSNSQPPSASSELKLFPTNGKQLLRGTSQQQLYTIQVSTLNQSQICHYTVKYTTSNNPIFELEQFSLSILSYSNFIDQYNSRFSFLVYRDVTDNNEDKKGIKQFRVIPSFNNGSCNINIYATVIAVKQKQDKVTAFIQQLYQQKSPYQFQTIRSNLKSLFAYNQSTQSEQFLSDDNQYGLTFRSADNSQANKSQFDLQYQQYRYYLIVVQNVKVGQGSINTKDVEESSQQNFRDDEVISIQVVEQDSQIELHANNRIINRIRRQEYTQERQQEGNAHTYRYKPEFCSFQAISPQESESQLPRASSISLEFNLIHGQCKIIVQDPLKTIIYEKILSGPQRLHQPISISSTLDRLKQRKKSYVPVIRIPDITYSFTVKVIAMSQEILYELQMQEVSQEKQYIALVPNLMYAFKVNDERNDSNSQLYQSGNQKYVIDARPSVTVMERKNDGQHSIQNKKNQQIHLVVSLPNKKEDNHSIETIIPQIKIQTQIWSKQSDKSQVKILQKSLYSLDIHNQFYIYHLPSMNNTKYLITLSKLQPKGEQTQISMFYYQSSDVESQLVDTQPQSPSIRPAETSSNVHSIIPFSIDSQTKTMVLPFGHVLQIPISSSQISVLFKLRTCGYQNLKAYIGQKGIMSLNQLSQLRQQGNNGRITVWRDQLNDNQLLVYVKSFTAGKIYLKVQSIQADSHKQTKALTPQSPQLFSNQSKRSLQYYFILEIVHDPKPHIGNYLTFNSQGNSNYLKYQLESSWLHITYSKLKPNVANIVGGFSSKDISQTKVFYKLYLAENLQQMGKMEKCQLKTITKGRQKSIFERVIQSQWLKDAIQRQITRDNSTSLSTQQRTAVVSLSQIKQHFHKYPQNLTIIIKSYLSYQSQPQSQTQVSSSSIHSQAQYQHQYSFRPLIVNDFSSRTSFFSSIRFITEMWIVLAVCMAVFFFFLLSNNGFRMFILWLKTRNIFNSKGQGIDQDLRGRKLSEVSKPEDNQSLQVISIAPESSQHMMKNVISLAPVSSQNIIKNELKNRKRRGSQKQFPTNTDHQIHL